MRQNIPTAVYTNPTAIDKLDKLDKLPDIKKKLQEPTDKLDMLDKLSDIKKLQEPTDKPPVTRELQDITNTQYAHNPEKFEIFNSDQTNNMTKEDIEVLLKRLL